MKNYHVIVMGFDGEMIRDSTGPLEDCQNAIENMGSKWFFYPWPIIATDRGYIREMGGVFCNTTTGTTTMHTMFHGKKITTVSKLFKKISESDEAQNVDVEVFESFVIDHVMTHGS